jgi:F1F0 ATPase subunit 2
MRKKMNNPHPDLVLTLLNLLGPMVAGIFIGLVFFYSLWLTVQKGSVSNHPLRWFLGGFLLRMSFAITGFYFVGQGQWQSFVACLLGFMLSRLLVGRLSLKPSNLQEHAAQAKVSKEMDHAIKP